MKKMHLRFYRYISGCLIAAFLAAVTLTLSVFSFVRGEIMGGIFATILTLIFLLVIWFSLKGGIVVDFHKNRLVINQGQNYGNYDLNTVRNILIAFRFDPKYSLYAAKVTIYFKNSKTESFEINPYHVKLSKNGIPFSNKERIERQASQCNFISCYTVN